MGPELVVALKADGVFTAVGPDGRFHVLFDGPDERWLVAGPVRGEDAPLVAMAADLDAALASLAAAAGATGRFSVSLPCGSRFSRPGRVPASEVLGAFGYSVVRSLTGFVVVESGRAEPDAAVRARLTAGLVGRPLDVGRVEFIERCGDVAFWCCDITMPFEGPIRPSRAAEVFRKAIAGAGLEAVAEVELDTPRPVLPNSASVLRLAPLVRAA